MNNNMYMLVLKGIPGSGKSTYARKMARQYPSKYVIVSRDSIREMLGVYWIPSREKLVSEIEIDMIKSAVKRGYNPIIDATNISSKAIGKWEALSIELDIEIKWRSFDVALKKAIFRDWWRGFRGGRTVGAKVIKKFYYKMQGNEG